MFLAPIICWVCLRMGHSACSTVHVRSVRSSRTRPVGGGRLTIHAAVEDAAIATPTSMAGTTTLNTMTQR